MTKAKPIPYFLMAFFFLFYLTITLCRYLQFSIGPLDFYVYLRRIWEMGHWQMSLDPFNRNVPPLADHWEPALFLVGFLSYFPFYNYLLLGFEALVCALGILPIYWLTEKLLNSKTCAVLLALCYGFSLGMTQAVFTPVHPGTWLGPVYAFLLWFAFEKKWGLYALCCLAALSLKETAGLHLSAIGLFLILYLNEKKVGVITVVLSLASFAIIVGYAMPTLSPHGTYAHQTQLGEAGSFSTFLLSFVRNPSLLLEVPLDSERKQFLLLALFASTGFLVFFNLGFLLLVIPLLAERVYSAIAPLHEISGHYSAPIAPILVISVLLTLKDRKYFQKGSRAEVASVYFLACTILFTLFAPKRPLWETFTEFDSEKVAAIQNSFREIKKYLPQNEKVFAQNLLIPQLPPLRDIGMPTLQNYQNYNYFLFSKKVIHPRPFSPEALQRLHSEFENASEIKLVFRNDYFALYAKKEPGKQLAGLPTLGSMHEDRRGLPRK